MSNDGSNPMRHDCVVKGCFNKKKRPKIERFAKCFPRKIAMSDIDGVVEQNGRFMFLEWKSHQGDLSYGQRTTFEKMTLVSGKFFVIVICGNAETMEVTHLRRIYRGDVGDWEPTTIEAVEEELTRWSDWTVRKVLELPKWGIRANDW